MNLHQDYLFRNPDGDYNLPKLLICDCGKPYVPKAKYMDPRVKCSVCIKSVSSAQVKEKCVEYLGGKCKDCNGIFHPVCFDFEHKDPANKSFKISGHYLFRWKELKKELDKTTLRCANCHRLRHYIEDHE